MQIFTVPVRRSSKILFHISSITVHRAFCFLINNGVSRSINNNNNNSYNLIASSLAFRKFDLTFRRQIKDGRVFRQCLFCIERVFNSTLLDRLFLLWVSVLQKIGLCFIDRSGQVVKPRPVMGVWTR